MKTLLQTINEKLKIRKDFNKPKHNDTSDLIYNIVEVLYNGLDLKYTDLGYYGARRPKNYLYCDDLSYEQFEEFIDIIKDNKQLYDINDDVDGTIKISMNTNTDISITFVIDTNNKEIYKISFSSDLLKLIKNYLNIN
jgi:hypothetical protein